MTDLALLFPERAAIAPDALAARIAAVCARDRWTERQALSFFQRLSELLLNHTAARQHPALQTLGFWLRKASLQPLIEATASPQTLLAPRGTVFQILPGNVDTLAGYATALSLALGNVTLARLSSNTTPLQEAWIDCLYKAAADDPSVRARLFLVRYAHDDALTTQLSALCDLRMVWGGDETVTHIARLPLPPLAQSVGFGDRFSACALNATNVLAMGGKERDALVRLLARTLLEFGQMACSSPRILYWIGRAEDCLRAEDDLLPRVAQAMDQSPDKADASAVAEKCGHAFLALHDLDAMRTTRHTPALTVVTLRSANGLPAFKDIPYGHGLLLTLGYDSLSSLAKSTERKDQTLAHAGFSAEDLSAFALQTNGRGFTRIVPLGQALDFDMIWDGETLVSLLSKTIRIVP